MTNRVQIARPGAGESPLVVAASARFAVDPAVLLAFRAAAPALAAQREEAGRMLPIVQAAPEHFGGPYGFTKRRWLGALNAEGARLIELAMVGLVAKPDAGDGKLRMKDAEVFAAATSAREDEALSSLVASANMDTHIRRVRAKFGVEPTLSELYVGHQAGGKMMVKMVGARTCPDATLAELDGSAFWRTRLKNLLALSGMQADTVRTVTCGEYQAKMEPHLKALQRAAAEELRRASSPVTSAGAFVPGDVAEAPRVEAAPGPKL